MTHFYRSMAPVVAKKENTKGNAGSLTDYCVYVSLSKEDFYKGSKRQLIRD